MLTTKNNGGDQAWKIANHPRETVSWYEAMAFCRWLSFQLWENSVGARHVSPLPQNGYDPLNPATWLIRLPTEAEWQRAAQGDDRRQYPWGNDYVSGYANIDETNRYGFGTKVGEHFLGKTTPVNQYRQGASPYGVLDMSGNVWEWCLTEYNTGYNRNITNSNKRILRGGSWVVESGNARSVYRFSRDPDNRSDGIGFRVLLRVSL